MRKFVFAFCLAMGIGVGLLSSWPDGWALKFMMMGIGAMFGGAIGSGLSSIGEAGSRGGIESTPDDSYPTDVLKDRWRRDLDDETGYGRDLAAGIRRRSVESDQHMFDPDKI